MTLICLDVKGISLLKSRGLDRDSKAQAEQIRSVSVERVGVRIGVGRKDSLARLDEALRLHLAL
jgi:mRNA interferase MazF